MPRVNLNPELLRWARKRARLSTEELFKRYPKLDAWEKGDLQPTLKQLEAFAKTTHAPIGYFFLSEPPIEELPIPDFRTMGSSGIRGFGPNLLDMINLCLERQDWYREFAQTHREDRRSFVGSAKLQTETTRAANSIRHVLGFDPEERSKLGSWEEALRLLISQTEDAGILVMCSGIVGNNTHRPLDPAEFRGFALADNLAPLIFINSKDTKAARMFTLAHEIAHLWLGQSALSSSQASSSHDHRVERWCNQVAAEVLVPLAQLKAVGNPSGADLMGEVHRLARLFKVSTLVILRRFHDAGWISREQMWLEYEVELRRLRPVAGSGGGSFFTTQPLRLSRRFATSVIVSTLSGQTLYSDAFHLLGIKKVSTLKDLGTTLGVPV